MRIKGDLCLSRHLPAIALYLTQQNWTRLQVRNQKYTVSYVKFLEPLVLWEKTLISLAPWDLTFKEILITKPQSQALFSQSFEMLFE